jgi:hypothetical protein
MKTAKELAFKAYIQFYNLHPDEMGERFEHWWRDNYIDGEYKDSFQPKHNVYVDGERYIQAE